MEKNRRYRTEVRHGGLKSRLRQMTGSGFEAAVGTQSGWKSGGGLERCNVSSATLNQREETAGQTHGDNGPV